MTTRKQGLFTKALMLAFALFLTLPAAATVSAQSPGWWGQDNNRRDRRQDRRERRRDRREDRRERRDDRRDDRRDGRWDGYGNNGGYNDGYGNYGGYGNSQLRQTALNAGYNEGIRDGRDDRNRRERFEYRDESDYQNASKDYSSRLGDRGQYQQYFRQGFANGYRDGYNGH